MLLTKYNVCPIGKTCAVGSQRCRECENYINSWWTYSAPAADHITVCREVATQLEIDMYKDEGKTKAEIKKSKNKVFRTKFNLKTAKYDLRNGCYNCNGCFIRGDYDSPLTYYCNVDQSERPLCGSVAMKEAHTLQTPRLSKREASKSYREWEKWSKERQVRAWGICNKWSQADKIEQNEWEIIKSDGLKNEKI